MNHNQLFLPHRKELQIEIKRSFSSSMSSRSFINSEINTCNKLSYVEYREDVRIFFLGGRGKVDITTNFGKIVKIKIFTLCQANFFLKKFWGLAQNGQIFLSPNFIAFIVLIAMILNFSLFHWNEWKVQCMISPFPSIPPPVLQYLVLGIWQDENVKTRNGFDTLPSLIVFSRRRQHSSRGRFPVCPSAHPPNIIKFPRRQMNHR